MEMKQGHLYRRRDGEVFLQEEEPPPSRIWWTGSDREYRRKNGRWMGVDEDDFRDAVRDYGPVPPWKEVVAMREEVERLRAWKADAMATVSEWDKVVEIARREGQAPFGGSFAEWTRNVFERVWVERNRLRAEVADLRAKLAVHERRLASGAEEPLGCPTPGACSCPVERANSVREAVAALKAYSADTDAELADAARPLAVGDVVVCVRASGVLTDGAAYRIRGFNGGGAALWLDGVFASWRKDRFRRATPAEVAEFEAKERKSAKERRRANQRSHVLYETGDKDAPGQILDRNGDVVLGMCRKCGRAEAELDEPCEKEERAKTKPSNFIDLVDRKIPPIPLGRRLETDYGATPHPEAMFTDGQTKEWTPRSRYTNGSAYHEDAAYIVPIAYDTPIPWHGGPCPVAEGIEVVVTLRIGETYNGKAGEFHWQNDDSDEDIVAYTAPSPKPAESDAAVALDPTSVVFATRGMEVRS